MLLAYLLENEPSNWDAALIVEHVRQIPPLTPFSALQNDLYLALQDISALNSVNREKKTKAKQWLKNWKGVVNQLKQAYAGTTNQDNDSRSDSSRSSSKISIVNYGQQNFNPSNAVFINKRNEKEVLTSDNTLDDIQPSSSSSQRRHFDRIFDATDPISLPSIDHVKFRHEVYRMALKALTNDMCLADYADLKSITDTFQPKSLAQQLDKMSASLILQGNLASKDVIALKLSTSHVIDCMNPTTKSLFAKHIKNNEALLAPTSSPIITAPGLRTESRQLFAKVIELGKDSDGIIKKKNLNQAICRVKLNLYDADEQDQQLLQVLDVMSVVLRSCIGDAGSYTPIASELTFYRKMAQILDIILEDTHLDLKDGEIMSKASKEICKANTKTFGAGFMMTGRRIDMIIESKDLELSTNEWKKDKVMNLSSKQQAKNIRTNKALLTKWLTYPIANDMIPRLSTLAMDWIGSTGYMFSVSQYEDAFVARFFSNLELPVYVANLPEFIDTLDALYVWKNHHCAMKDILLPAISKKESHSVLANLVPAHDLPQSVCPEVSPNVLFTPSKRRRTSKGTSAGPCNPYDSQDDTDDEDENNL